MDKDPTETADQPSVLQSWKEYRNKGGLTAVHDYIVSRDDIPSSILELVIAADMREASLSALVADLAKALQSSIHLAANKRTAKKAQDHLVLLGNTVDTLLYGECPTKFWEIPVRSRDTMLKLHGHLVGLHKTQEEIFSIMEEMGEVISDYGPKLPTEG